ncbi:ATP-grasp domain-containing protein [Streptacidiphilus melanogenes]|uniref:ATP-grasp domain-containing protein n=1 Tax=Streptacidiphilus melanogenes TaxID=411235 RepID=UPI0005A70079|nr:ATP-grasp domain-containing protein [Streptacidiphilus melanogenes]
MHVVLTSSTAPHAEILHERGQEVMLVVPGSASVGHRDFPVWRVSAWDAYGELARLALDLVDEPVASLTTTDERCLRPAAWLRSMLGLPGMSWEQSVAGTDKHIMKQKLARAQIPVARHLPVATLSQVPTAADSLGWPVVVKLRTGASMLGTTRLDSEQEFWLARSNNRFGPFAVPTGWDAAHLDLGLTHAPGGLMVEQALTVVAEWHVEVLRWRGQEVYVLPGRYTAPLLDTHIVGSVLLPTASDEAREVAALARAAADALGLTTGFAHAEVMLTADGDFVLGEIGLRPGGGRLQHLVELQHGVDPFALQADLAMDRRPLVRLRPEHDPIAWASPFAPPGLVTGVTPLADILAMPGVIGAEETLAVGDVSTGQVGTAITGGHVYATGPNAEVAMARAAAAAAAWQTQTVQAPTVPAHA